MNEQLKDAWPVLVGLLPLLSNLVKLFMGVLPLMGKCSGERKSRPEIFESRRVFGGILGLAASGAVVFPLADLQAEPIICLALVGGVFGGRERRVNAMAIGAVVGFFLALAFTTELVPDPPAAKWWLAASFPPLGGLVAGYLSDKDSAKQ